MKASPPAGDNLAEWEAYLDTWQSDTHRAKATTYAKCLDSALTMIALAAHNYVLLTLDQILGLADLLTESQQEMVYRRTTPDHPIPVQFVSLTRPTELAAVAHIVFGVVHGERDVIVDAPYGELYCAGCGMFHKRSAFYTNDDKPRGYEDSCRDYILRLPVHLQPEWLRRQKAA